MSDRLVGTVQFGKSHAEMKLATERELCKSFGVHHQTLREATRKLTDLGLIERRRCARTHIIRQHPKPHFALEFDTTYQLQRYLEFTDLHVHKKAHVETRHPRETKLEGTPDDWLKVQTHHSAPCSKRPISWTGICLREEYIAVFELISTRSGDVYPMLETCCGGIVETMEMEFSSAHSPPVVAHFLGYDATEPDLLTSRPHISQRDGQDHEGGSELLPGL